MKIDPYQKKSLVIFSILSIIITAVDGIFIIFFPHVLQSLLPINVFFIVFAIFLALTPFARQKLNCSEGCRRSFFTWLFSIFLIEGLALLLFVSLLQTSQLFSQTEIIPLAINVPPAWQIMHWLLLDWGLFPFSLIAVLAAGLAYMHYRQRHAATISQLMPSVKKTYYEIFIKRVVNGSLGVVSNFVLIISVSVGLLALGRLLLSVWGVNDIVQLRIGGFIFFIAITALSSAKTLRWLAFKLSYLIKSEALAIFIFMFIALFIFLFCYFCALPVLHFVGSYIILPDFHHLNTNHRLHIYWPLLIWGWWICWAPLLASAIARMSYGYSMFSVIIASLLLPFILALCVFNHWIIPFLMPIATAIFHTYILALVGPVLLIAILMKIHGGRLMVFGFMPADESDLATRTVKPINFVRQVLQLTVAFMGVFLIRNVYGLQFLTLLAAIPNTVFFIVLALLFYKKLVFLNLKKANDF